MFHEDWFSDESCKALAHFADLTKKVRGYVIEIGCWEGRSTIALANAINPAILHAVDTWEGSPGEPSERLAHERDVFATFTANIEAETAGNVVAHRMDWRDFFAGFQAPIRLCHIDATHSYDEVRDNVVAVLARLQPGGIICGDDAHHPPVQRAVLDVLGKDVLATASLWHWKKPVVTLEDEYRRLCRTPSDIYEHLPVFFHMVGELGATKVIELGTRSGVSTIAWLYGLHDQGELWSVDLDPQPPIGDWPHWTFIQGDDLNPDVVRQLPSDADVVFIDTSHAYAQTLAELNVYSRKVRPGGRIVLHDTELRRPELVGPQPPFPVKKAVTEFCDDEALKVEFLPNCFGLAIITIPEG